MSAPKRTHLGERRAGEHIAFVYFAEGTKAKKVASFAGVLLEVKRVATGMSSLIPMKVEVGESKWRTMPKVASFASVSQARGHPNVFADSNEG